MATDNPTIPEWRALYAAAVRFRDHAPWQWMHEAQVFGVQNPETREIGYCSIMGGAGEHFSLCAYRGRDGLLGLQRMRETPPWLPDTNPIEFLALQDSLMASFEDRERIEAEDRAVMQSLGLKFRGRGAWPLFRSYLPGSIPWTVTVGEARFLTVALEQSLAVALRAVENPGLVTETEFDEPKLVRVRGENGEWRDDLMMPPPPVLTRYIAPDVDSKRIEALLALPRAIKGTIEVGAERMPHPMANGEEDRPAFPFVMLALAVAPRPARKTIAPEAPSKNRRRIVSRRRVNPDETEGRVIAHGVTSPARFAETAVEVLLGGIEVVGGLPADLVVARDDLYHYLRPVADSLQIELRREETVPSFSAAASEMLAAFGAFG